VNKTLLINLSILSKINDYLMPRAEVIVKQAKQYLDKIGQIQQTLTVEDEVG